MKVVALRRIVLIFASLRHWSTEVQEDIVSWSFDIACCGIRSGV